MNNDRNKRVALVTGGTRGIGLGIARALATEGFSLALNGIRPPQDIQPVLDEFTRAGTEAIYCRGDVSCKEDREQILRQTAGHYGRLNVLVNNAGIAPQVRADLLEASEESFEQLILTNLQGPYFLTQSAVRMMIGEKESDPAFEGCVITVSSISARVASVNRGEYCVAKAGLAMMTKLFAVRLGEYGIPVYELRPGVIQTDMTAGVKESYKEKFAAGLTLQNRWGQPEDIGKAAAALATGAIPYATGQVITIDGGLTVERL